MNAEQPRKPHVVKAPLFMNQNFAVIVLGGTGQVGGAAVAELLAIPQCREVVMVTRKPIAARARLGRSIAAEIALHHLDKGEVTRENAAMKQLAAELTLTQAAGTEPRQPISC